jgi:hypothetical protein
MATHHRPTLRRRRKSPSCERFILGSNVAGCKAGLHSATGVFCVADDPDIAKGCTAYPPVFFVQLMIR